MHKEDTPKDLEPRFHQPEGWRWHEFIRNGRRIRFGTVTPKNPDAVLICLQGVREFSEKYYEIAHWCLSKNMTFWTFDWAGQGKSSRFIGGSQKRHTDGFLKDIEDLEYLISQYVIGSSVRTDHGRIPMAMLAHSMGANLGLQYIHNNPEDIKCAAFTAPMFGIKAFHHLPQPLALAASALCRFFAGKEYIPGGSDWQKGRHRVHLSSDPVRSLVHDIWCEHDIHLQAGEVTFRWLYEAQKSCMRVQKKAFQKNIKIPCLFGIPGNEGLVDNTIAQKVMSGIKDSKEILYPGSFHEILMEKDDIRDDFLNHLYGMIEENIIRKPESLKPF